MISPKTIILAYLTICVLPVLSQNKPKSKIETVEFMPCDTLVLKSGVIELVKIAKEAGDYLTYFECKDKPKSSYEKGNKILMHKNNIDTIKKATLKSYQFEWVDTERKMYWDMTAFYSFAYFNASSSVSYQFTPRTGIGISWFYNQRFFETLRHNFITADYRISRGKGILTAHVGHATSLTKFVYEYCDVNLIKNKWRPAIGVSLKGLFLKNTLIGYRLFWTQVPTMDHCYSIPLQNYYDKLDKKNNLHFSFFVGIYFPKHFDKVYYLKPN
ncbi:MAG: hypothetical protein JNL70_23710 [Saprospiraceae bacterium]|nr:hypothetical protein [Saprospiraceae bacterium]